jgi:hypothetical protein
MSNFPSLLKALRPSRLGNPVSWYLEDILKFLQVWDKSS